MADQTFDTRLELLLRSTLAGEVASLPLSVTADQVLERRRMRRGTRVSAPLDWPRLSMAFAAGAMAVVIVVAGFLWWNLFLNQKPIIGPSATATPTVTVAPTKPTTQPSLAVEPTSTPSPAEPSPTPVRPVSGEVPLDWSSDGTRLLVQKGGENLFIRNADGSERQVTEQLSKEPSDPRSARPRGATISPDGSRVVFAGVTKRDALSCHNGALLAVDADGGPAELLWTSQIPQNGLLSYPTFSPDGTKIAFSDGYCDHDHSVWVMNADGSDAHQIGSPDQAGLVYGVAWSPDGDRIALGYSGFDRPSSYIFWADGSGLTQDTNISEFCWAGRQC